jgi:hypothetical protein
LAAKAGVKPLSAANPPTDASPSIVPKRAPLGQRIDEAVQRRGQNTVDILKKTGAQSDFSTGFQTGGEVLGLANDVAGETISSIPGSDLGPRAVKAVLETKHPEFLPGDTGRMVELYQTAKPVISKVREALGGLFDRFKEKHPEAAANLEALGEAGQFAANATIAKDALDVVPNQPVKAVKEVPGKIADAAEAAKVNKQKAAIDQLEADYSKWAGSTKSGAKAVTKAETRTAAYNASGAVEAKTPQRVLAEARVVPKVEGTKFATAEQAENFRQTVQPLNEAMQPALREVELQAPAPKIEQMRAKTIERVRSLRMTEGDRQSMIRNIDNDFDLLEQKYKGEIPVTKLADEKSNYWGATRFDSTNPFKADANYQIAKTMQETIEESAKSAGFEDVAQLNREIGDRLEASKFLERLDGQTLKGGRLSKYVFGLAGAAMGNTIPGKILGMIGGNMVAEILMSTSVSTPVKRLLLKSIETKSPEAYEATLKWLNEQGLERSTRLLLPSPAELGSPRNPIIPEYKIPEKPTVIEPGVKDPRFQPENQNPQIKKFYQRQSKAILPKKKYPEMGTVTSKTDFMQSLLPKKNDYLFNQRRIF